MYVYVQINLICLKFYMLKKQYLNFIKKKKIMDLLQNDD